jgi:catechol 2,3-dioxygenase-like lactoylglutathione lyase family enzyme
MYELDHVAIQTNDVPATARYYIDHYGAEVLYESETWAFLRLGQGKLALVRPEQHPAHVAFRVDIDTLRMEADKAGKSIDTHRDGTQGIYVNDPHGNVIELICYPPGETAYAAKPQ